MAIFVHITDNCKEGATVHTWQDRLASFARDLERKQTVRMFEHFPPPYIVKKKFGEYAGRLIGAHIPVGEDSVVVLLAAMMRGSADYEAFSTNPESYGAQHFDELYSEEELAEFVKTRKHKDPPAPKAPVGEEEYGYLHGVLQHPHAGPSGDDGPEDSLVAESPDWVRRCVEPHFKNLLIKLHEAVSGIENFDIVGGAVVPLPGKPDYSVLLRRFPGHSLLWLGAPLQSSNQDELARLRKNYNAVLNEETPALETILKASRRAYPDMILADEQLWMNLQRETQANMALSPEESKVLRSARRTTTSGGTMTGGFPMFINGRAGSGKTTILQYLFAEFLFYHLTKPSSVAPPMYFTCNPELLRSSKEVVLQLLRCGAKWWDYEGSRDLLINENKFTCEGAFREFHQHLLNLVEPEARAKRFPPDRYVGYAKFKQLWTKRFGQTRHAQRDFGPDLSWHVIRSYIKGLSSDDLLRPEEYQHLDRKQITVTQGSYKTVYDKVWVDWYELQSGEDGFWDDQDLARYLIEADDKRREFESENPEAGRGSNQAYGLQPVHPVIFCDESQDFTRIELEVILRLSLFAERALGREEIALVPFIFAGDQFQTLNPTGFRWESVKAFFVEKFIFALATQRPKNLDLNYCELSYNYRSSRRIVEFSNYVQALRARLFDLASLQPQLPWEQEPNPPAVTLFDRDNDALWTQLKKASDLVIIVPCGEGEEIDYVKNDPVLKSKVGFNEDGSMGMTVVTAIGAKGLEFPRVVVYGFGEAADEDLLAPLKNPSMSYADDPDKSLPKQYFINRLYVAVSRAKRRLFIVDSNAGSKKLWDFAYDNALEKAILDGLKNGRSTWGSSIARLERGRVEDITSDKSIDPIEIAVSLASDGRARSYAPHLLQAANIYKNNGHEQDAMRCRAEAARIEGKYLEAAEQFLGCKDVHQATDCFWKEGRKGWPALVHAANTHPDLIPRLEYGFARAINGKPSVQEITGLLVRLEESLAEEAARIGIISGNSWPEALRACIDALVAITATSSEWLAVFHLVEKVTKAGLRFGPLPRAQLAFRAGEMERAVKLWDEAGERGSNEYKLAKAHSAPYPDRLVTLYELGKKEEILTEYLLHKDSVLNPDQSRYVGRAYLHKQDYPAALKFLVEGRDVSGIAELIRSTFEHDSTLANRACRCQFAVIAANGEWGEALPFVMGEGLPGIPRPSAELSKWAAGHTHFDVALMRAMARSESLGNLTWDAKREKVRQKPFAEYLIKAFPSSDEGVEMLGAMVKYDFWSELGAAIERSGSRKGALSFYERLANDSSHPTGRRRTAKERWIVCKERQAQFTRQEGDARTASIQTAEAKKERQKLGIANDHPLEAFPRMDSIASYLNSILHETSEEEAKADFSQISGPSSEPHTDVPAMEQGLAVSGTPVRTEAPVKIAANPQYSAEQLPSRPLQRWNLFGKEFELFRDTGRLNVKDDHGVQMAIRPGKGTCSSEDLEILKSDKTEATFTIEEWGLEVGLSDPMAVSLMFLKEAILLKILLR